MTSLIIKKNGFIDSKLKTLYIIKKDNKITLYAAFIIKPRKTEIEKKTTYGKVEKVKITDVKALFSLLDKQDNLRISLHRIIIPGKIKKIKKIKRTDDNHEEQKELESIQVSVSYYVIKVSRTFNLDSVLLTLDEIIKEFRQFILKELKYKLYTIGTIGRLRGRLLEEVVIYNTIDKSHLFLDEKGTIFSELAKEFITIDKIEDIKEAISPGPAIDRRETAHVFPEFSGINSAYALGTLTSNQEVGLPFSHSYPILLAGDEQTRQKIKRRILLNSNRFLVIEPKTIPNTYYSGIEYEKLQLGKNFTFNVLSPNFSSLKIEERDFKNYLSDLLSIIKELTETRNEIIMQIPEIINFYITEYKQDEIEELINMDYSKITINDIYTMLSSEPGGLVISDFQLSSLKAVLTNIGEESINGRTVVNGLKGVEHLFNKNAIVELSNHSLKVQRLLVYSLLLQLSLYSHLANNSNKNSITVIIEQAELFFPTESEKTFISKLLSLIDCKSVKVILSTTYPSHIAPSVFDLTSNKIIGNLRSAKCAKIIADTHSLSKEQREALLRLPTNSFLILRQDYYEKPILARHIVEKKPINRVTINRPTLFGENQKTGSISPHTFSAKDSPAIYANTDNLVPIIIAILKKLASKVPRGINTESFIKLFPEFNEDQVAKAVTLLELRGYIFKESVDKKGRKGEFWTKITPKGEKYLQKLEISLLLKNGKESKNAVSSKINYLTNQDQEFTERIEGKNISIINNEIVEKNKVKTNKLLDILTIELEKIDLLSNSSVENEKDRIIKLYSILNELIDNTEYEKIADNISEKNKLIKITSSLKELANNDENFNNISHKITEKIFDNVKRTLSRLYSQIIYGENTGYEHQKLDKIVSDELKKEKWTEFETDSSINRDKSPYSVNSINLQSRTVDSPNNNKLKINNKLFLSLRSQNSEEILKTLEENLTLSKEQFVVASSTAISSLIKNKINFHPNMDNSEFLECINSFFSSKHFPTPFSGAQKLLWRYANTSFYDEEQESELKQEIIELMKKENSSFYFDIDDTSRESLVIQLINKITKRMKKDE